MNKFGKEISYQMSRKAFDAMLEKRSENEKKENPYVYVMKIINEQYGLKGIVTSISLV